MIQDGAMTGTSVLTDTIFLGKNRGYFFALEWTGTPAGNFKIQVNGQFPNWKQGQALPTFDEDRWEDVPDSTVAAGGAVGHHSFDGETSAPWVRLHYTNSSSTGTLQCTGSKKD